MLKSGANPMLKSGTKSNIEVFIVVPRGEEISVAVLFSFFGLPRLE